MKLTLKSIFVAACAIIIGSSLEADAQQYYEMPIPAPQIPFAPKRYLCYRTAGEMKIDGHLDEPSWNKAAWTDYFVDIEGDSKPAPLYKTRAKMLWDDHYLYVGAEIQEPNLWATLRQRDTAVLLDNDFEVFVDPNGSTQPYYEIEVNQLGAVWDLLLLKPFRDGRKVAVAAWDIHGLNVGIALHGTLNNPSDVDTGWTLELAFPWKVLGECALNGAPPTEGSQWRINFLRVEWRTEVEDGHYVKPKSSRPEPWQSDYNWAWSPQGLVSMHYPEMWGFVQFSDTIAGHGTDEFKWNRDEDAKWVLRKIYYGEKRYKLLHGDYTNDVSALGVSDVKLDGYTPPQIETTFDMFEAVIENSERSKTIHIRDDGMTWETKDKR